MPINIAPQQSGGSMPKTGKSPEAILRIAAPLVFAAIASTQVACDKWFESRERRPSTPFVEAPLPASALELAEPPANSTTTGSSPLPFCESPRKQRNCGTFIQASNPAGEIREDSWCDTNNDGEPDCKTSVTHYPATFHQTIDLSTGGITTFYSETSAWEQGEKITVTTQVPSDGLAMTLILIDENQDDLTFGARVLVDGIEVARTDRNNLNQLDLHEFIEKSLGPSDYQSP